MGIPNSDVVSRLAERLKTADGDDFFTEEDRLELAQQAIQVAFFKPRTTTVGSGYNVKTTTEDPLVVEMVRTTFKPYVEAKVKAACDELAATPEFKTAVAEAMAYALPAILTAVSSSFMSGTIHNAPQEAVQMLAARLRAL
jgi:hypothetical protein